MQDKFKSVSDQIQKNEDKLATVTEKVIHLEKDNANLKGRVSSQQSELSQKEQLIDKLEQQKRDLDRIISSGKDFDK